jgi:nucleotide-binding universal stress UspA family protein
MFKTILVHVDDNDPASPDRIIASHRLAAASHAKLIGVAVALPPATVELLASGGAIVAAGLITGDPHELDDRFQASKAQFARLMAREGGKVQTDWRNAIDFPAAALASMASLADLVVVGPARTPAPANSYLDHGDLVMKAGRPVLVVPHGTDRFGRGTVIAAWRNTREARRALADALPLLAAAEAVHLVHVLEAGEGRGETAHLADAAAYLGGHGIDATTHLLESEGLSPAQRLLEFATRAEATLIVSGAYGRARLREWVFGGVTRDLLRECPFTCLFSR